MGKGCFLLFFLFACFSFCVRSLKFVTLSRGFVEHETCFTSSFWSPGSREKPGFVWNSSEVGDFKVFLKKVPKSLPPLRKSLTFWKPIKMEKILKFWGFLRFLSGFLVVCPPPRYFKRYAPASLETDILNFCDFKILWSVFFSASNPCFFHSQKF